MDYKLLGEQIRKQRRALGWTQEELAEAIGVSTSFVGHIELGKRNPSLETLVDIANAMQVSVDFLLGSNLASAGQNTGSLTANQKAVLKDILDNLQNEISRWNAPPSDGKAD